MRRFLHARFVGMAAAESMVAARRALDELYRSHAAEVYRYAYAVLGNHADAEDVTQTTFVNALRALERGERPRKPSNWLITITHNIVRQRFRQQQARPAEVELVRDVAQEPEESNGPSMEELVRALQRIPQSQREALVLRELEGRSYDEIAETLNLTKSALETLLFRARRSLADELENAATCDRAELSLSRQLDGRISRKERRRLLDHIAECPACARLQVTQGKQRRAFKGLALLPLPFALTFFKGAPSASAATGLPTIGAAGAAGTTAVVGGGTATGGGLSLGGLARRRRRPQGGRRRRGRVGRGRRRPRRRARDRAEPWPRHVATSQGELAHRCDDPRGGSRIADAGQDEGGGSAPTSRNRRGRCEPRESHGRRMREAQWRGPECIGSGACEGAGEGWRRWRSPRPPTPRTRRHRPPTAAPTPAKPADTLPAREAGGEGERQGDRRQADKDAGDTRDPGFARRIKDTRDAGNARNSGVIVGRERRRPDRRPTTRPPSPKSNGKAP